MHVAGGNWSRCFLIYLPTHFLVTTGFLLGTIASKQYELLLNMDPDQLNCPRGGLAGLQDPFNPSCTFPLLRLRW